MKDHDHFLELVTQAYFQNFHFVSSPEGKEDSPDHEKAFDILWLNLIVNIHGGFG